MSYVLAFIIAKDENDARVNLTLFVEWNGLFTTICTLYEQKDFQLRPTGVRLRDSFESNEINNLQWIPGPLNLSDGLTTFNPHSFKFVIESMKTGLLQDKLCKQLYLVYCF